jgi:hypothetical protein
MPVSRKTGFHCRRAADPSVYLPGKRMNDPLDDHPADPALDDTVADEEVETADGPRLPPPVPLFRERPSEPDRSESHRPPLPAIFRGIDLPPTRSEESTSKRRWRDDLGDTPSLADSQVGRYRAPRADHVRLEEIFDRPEQLIVGTAAEYDPEAGRSNVAIKIQAVRQVVRSAAATPFGRLILAIPFGLAGMCLSIMAVTMQDLWVCIAAGVVMPVALILIYARYQAWLGHKRYMYRLLESLGEDVSGFDPRKTYRRVRGTTPRA